MKTRANGLECLFERGGEKLKKTQTTNATQPHLLCFEWDPIYFYFDINMRSDNPYDVSLSNIATFMKLGWSAERKSKNRSERGAPIFFPIFPIFPIFTKFSHSISKKK